jgi:hypothetical protein
VDDTIVTTESASEVKDDLHVSTCAKLVIFSIWYSLTACVSSCFANAMGAMASFPGPLSDPAVSELWILLGSKCW